MVAFTRVRLHQNVCQLSFASKSKWLLLLVCAYIKMVASKSKCAYIKMFANSRLHLNQNGCFYSCAPELINSVCAYIKMFANSRLHLNQNVCFFSCAPTSNFFPVLVFAYIENNVSLFLCASVSEGLLLLVSSFVFYLCNYSNVPLCVSFDVVSLHGL